MIRKIILLIITTLSCFFCQGQNSKINFHSIRDGLSNPYVKCIIKDSRGYLWFGTNEGLNKFDGSNFTVYEKSIKNPNSLSNNTINTILEDKDLNLWIGTGNGLCIYSRQQDNFKVFRNIGNERLPSISSLFEDDNNNIWIGTSGMGLYKYDKSKDSLYSYMPDDNDTTSISSTFINSIISDKKGRIWVGTRNGLDLFYAKDNETVRRNYNYKLPDELKACYIRKLCIDKDGNLWVGTYGKGLYELIDKDNDWHINHYQVSEEKGSLSNNDILSIICDKKGSLWIGTENGGLNVLPYNSTDFLSYKTEDGNLQGISSNSIWSLYLDNTGIIWIGTFNRGVNFVDERIGLFDVFYRNIYESKTLVSNNVVNFTEDRERNIWIATDGGGVSSFNPVTRSFTNKIDNTSITSKSVMVILCDSRQRLWVGTWGGGIDLFNTSGRKIKNYQLEAYDRPGNIFSLMEDRNGNIWAGTAGNGLFLFNPKKNDFTKIFDDTKRNSLSPTSFVNVFIQDSENTYWIGLPNGLVSMKYVNGEKLFTSYIHTEDLQSISSSGIASILEDSRHNLWIGTNEGLNLLNKEKGTFTVYRKENGLPNNTINGILEDNNHCLWISTYGGISKFDITKGTFKNYSTDDRLLSNIFNPRSSLKTRSGQFFMGCNSGFVTFFPDSIMSNSFIPPVYLTDLKIFNTTAIIGAKGSPLSKSLSETKHIRLNYKQTSFTIEFVALNFTNSAKNQYSYKLEGFDENWNYAGTKQYATYTNIDAGKYVFKVKGANNEGIWNPTPVQLEITVLAPYWKTKWAYLFYFICIAVILWGFFDLLIIKSNQSQKLRFEKIHHERSEELNRMKIQFFANISHEFRTPLTLIIAPLKQIIDHEPLKNDVKKRVELVYRNANRLLGLINELMDFTKSEEGRLKMLVQKVDIVSFSGEIYNMFIEEAQRRNINYTFESEFDSIEAWLDKSKAEKIINNLISNAFKFTPDKGNIRLKISNEITKDQSFVAISLFDDGSGISNEYIDKVFDRFFQSPEDGIKNISGTGIGLALVKVLVELHHGTISVTSQKWKETCFTVKIPLGNTHFTENEIFDESDENNMTPNQIYLGGNNEEKIKPNRNAPLILIVEDNFQLLEYLASILARKYHTLKAADGAEGLKIARDAIPDLILSDISMPRLSGIELCKTIKNEMATSHIPVVLLTARVSTPDIIEGIGTGADAYITKPFDNLLLEVTIEKTIETRRKLYQRFSQDVYIIPTEYTENELDRKFLKNIIDYIDKNASHNNITVETLASYLLMSRTSVYRKIKALTGQTATEFIRFTMLKMSIKLLEEGKYNISEIAFKVGFSSPGYFAKCFKSHYGKSPSDFVTKGNNKG